MNDITKLSLEDFDGNPKLFCDKCYECYISVWKNKPLFNNKIINRCFRLEKNKEVSFWGLVEGHNDAKYFKYLERYKAIPFFNYIITNLNNTKNNNDSDIIWLVQQKRVTVISKKYNYFLRLNEMINKVELITGYPISEKKKNNLINEWFEYWEEIEDNQGR